MDQARWEKAKKLVQARDGGKCLRCLGEADEVHHRIVRGMAGSGDPDVNYGLANLISLCRQCHDEVHASPEESYLSGFLVHSWMSPERTPLMVRPGTFYAMLTKEGDIEITRPVVLF